MHRGPDSGGKTHIKKVNGNDLAVDNSFVVPYNPTLYLRFQAHINVEIVHSVQAVKYLYKYITKGQDQVLLGFGEDTENDEINRYISASEALCRLYGCEIHRKHPPVEKLPCHLPDQQTVLFEPEQVGEAVETGPPPTKLTVFFLHEQRGHQCKNHPLLRFSTVLYMESEKAQVAETEARSKKP